MIFLVPLIIYIFSIIVYLIRQSRETGSIIPRMIGNSAVSIPIMSISLAFDPGLTLIYGWF